MDSLTSLNIVISVDHDKEENNVVALLPDRFCTATLPPSEAVRLVGSADLADIEKALANDKRDIPFANITQIEVRPRAGTLKIDFLDDLGVARSNEYHLGQKVVTQILDRLAHQGANDWKRVETRNASFKPFITCCGIALVIAFMTTSLSMRLKRATVDFPVIATVVGMAVLAVGGLLALAFLVIGVWVIFSPGKIIKLRKHGS